MNIGQASKASGVSAKMIRYYEQIGLIPAANRTESGYRAYASSDVHRLQFIRSARDLGFAVAEIGNLLNLWNDQSRQSADVKQLAQQHIEDLNARIAQLQEVRDSLQSLIHCCAGDARPDCPILQSLAKEGEEVQIPHVHAHAHTPALMVDGDALRAGHRVR